MVLSSLGIDFVFLYSLRKSHILAISLTGVVWAWRKKYCSGSQFGYDYNKHEPSQKGWFMSH